MAISAKPLLAALLAALLSACAGPDKVVDDSDPIEDLNRKVYGFNDSLDRNLFQPLARGYVKITPDAFRTGVTNFFDNVSYLNVVLNSMLQGKVRQTGSDATRFVLNSSFGIGGLFDVATPMGFPENDEDFGQTLATWGLAQGAYLDVPFAGPNTVRDVPDFVSSAATNPLTYIAGIAILPVGAFRALNNRANLLKASEVRDEASLDPYAFTRGAYLQRREFLIYDGAPPEEDFELLLDEEFDE